MRFLFRKYFCFTKNDMISAKETSPNLFCLRLRFQLIVLPSQKLQLCKWMVWGTELKFNTRISDSVLFYCKYLTFYTCKTSSICLNVYTQPIRTKNLVNKILQQYFSHTYTFNITYYIFCLYSVCPFGVCTFQTHLHVLKYLICRILQFYYQ